MQEVQPEFRYYTVGQINSYVKEYLDEDNFLQGLWIRGEISAYKEHSSGHIYFTLRDEQLTLRCVLFKTHAGYLEFEPKPGMDVLVWGKISIYERDATCQLYAEAIIPAGLGDYHTALEQLKNKLTAEGLFDLQRKKPLPRFAFRIAVVTSKEGAAWADIQKVARHRSDAVHLLLFATQVQGEKAPTQIAQALRLADQSGCDLILLARGGGSKEDLAAFDTEAVVRAVACCQTPVISGIGHETDVSLADLAADYRAATPSHAAQTAIAPKQDLLDLLEGYEAFLRRKLSQAVQKETDRLDQSSAGLDKYFIAALTAKENTVGKLATQLDLLSPLKVLARGYCVCYKDDGTVLKNAFQTDLGEEMNVQLSQGKLRCQVTERSS